MAEREISKYRRRQEDLFAEREKTMVEKAAAEREVQKAKAEDAADLEGQMAANKERVITDLIDRVLTVNLEVPRVVKADFE